MKKLPLSSPQNLRIRSIQLKLKHPVFGFCAARGGEANKLALKIHVKVLAVPHTDNKDKNLTLFNYVSNTITA